jgi:hypothetical protein
MIITLLLLGFTGRVPQMIILASLLLLLTMMHG